VKASRGDRHKYLGMEVDFRKRGCVRFEQFGKVADMIDNGPVKLKKSGTAMTPASSDLMSRDDDAKFLSKQRKEQYHNIVAKGIFMAKRSRPDIRHTVAVLAMRVREPNESNWNKMVRLLKYLNGTRQKCLIVCCDPTRSLNATHGSYSESVKPMLIKSFLYFLYHNNDATNIPYSTFVRTKYNTFSLFL